jgi:hypothetical protein
VAKLVDALCSGRSVRKDVLVRIQSWAHQMDKSKNHSLYPFFLLLADSALMAQEYSMIIEM